MAAESAVTLAACLAEKDIAAGQSIVLFSRSLSVPPLPLLTLFSAELALTGVCTLVCLLLIRVSLWMRAPFLWVCG